jgi:hypothetical protein
MVSMPGPRGSEKLNARIFAQNTCGFNHVKEHEQQHNQTEKRERNIRTSAQPEAEKTQEQHHNAQHVRTLPVLAMHLLLFELWGLNTDLTWFFNISKKSQTQER